MMGGDDTAERARAMVYALDATDGQASSGIAPQGLPGAMRRLFRPTVTRTATLRRIIDEDRVALHYQPVVQLRSGRVHYHEVLARLDDGRSPVEWIRIAETLGVVRDFDLLICRKAVAALRRLGQDWHGALAVNLSAQSMQSAGFVDSLLGLLATEPARPWPLMFEVTASSGIKDFTAVDQAIQALRGAGYPVCLDDFCAGPASLRYLQALGVDLVKIDGAFVRRIDRSARDYAMLKTVVALCRDLGFATVAEIVETETQAALLRDLGVDYGQGYHFARPAPEPTLSPTATAADGPLFGKAARH